MKETKNRYILRKVKKHWVTGVLTIFGGTILSSGFASQAHADDKNPDQEITNSVVESNAISGAEKSAKKAKTPKKAIQQATDAAFQSVAQSVDSLGESYGEHAQARLNAVKKELTKDVEKTLQQFFATVKGKLKGDKQGVKTASALAGRMVTEVATDLLTQDEKTTGDTSSAIGQEATTAEQTHADKKALKQLIAEQKEATQETAQAIQQTSEKLSPTELAETYEELLDGAGNDAVKHAEVEHQLQTFNEQVANTAEEAAKNAGKQANSPTEAITTVVLETFEQASTAIGTLPKEARQEAETQLEAAQVGLAGKISELVTPFASEHDKEIKGSKEKFAAQFAAEIVENILETVTTQAVEPGEATQDVVQTVLQTHEEAIATVGEAFDSTENPIQLATFLEVENEVATGATTTDAETLAFEIAVDDAAEVASQQAEKAGKSNKETAADVLSETFRAVKAQLTSLPEALQKGAEKRIQAIEKDVTKQVTKEADGFASATKHEVKGSQAALVAELVADVATDYVIDAAESTKSAKEIRQETNERLVEFRQTNETLQAEIKDGNTSGTLNLEGVIDRLSEERAGNEQEGKVVQGEVEGQQIEEEFAEHAKQASALDAAEQTLKAHKVNVDTESVREVLEREGISADATDLNVFEQADVVDVIEAIQTVAKAGATENFVADVEAALEESTTEVTLDELQQKVQAVQKKIDGGKENKQAERLTEAALEDVADGDDIVIRGIERNAEQEQGQAVQGPLPDFEAAVEQAQGSGTSTYAGIDGGNGIAEEISIGGNPQGTNESNTGNETNSGGGTITNPEKPGGEDSGNEEQIKELLSILKDADYDWENDPDHLRINSQLMKYTNTTWNDYEEKRNTTKANWNFAIQMYQEIASELQSETIDLNVLENKVNQYNQAIGNYNASLSELRETYANLQELSLEEIRAYAVNVYDWDKDEEGLKLNDGEESKYTQRTWYQYTVFRDNVNVYWHEYLQNGIQLLEKISKEQDKDQLRTLILSYNQKAGAVNYSIEDTRREFQGLVYSSEYLNQQESQKIKSQMVQVYDFTNDPENLFTERNYRIYDTGAFSAYQTQLTAAKEAATNIARLSGQIESSNDPTIVKNLVESYNQNAGEFEKLRTTIDHLTYNSGWQFLDANVQNVLRNISEQFPDYLVENPINDAGVQKYSDQDWESYQRIIRLLRNYEFPGVFQEILDKQEELAKVFDISQGGGATQGNPFFDEVFTIQGEFLTYAKEKEAYYREQLERSKNW